jgi:GTPase SAR1 family protein
MQDWGNGLMNETKLREHVNLIFEQAMAETRRSDALKSLHRELLLARERLDQPMRVAIVGLIKAGKSTMMNALLGETLVPTGTIEATFNVNWLKFGRSASLLVHFKDGHHPKAKSLEDLERLTRRSEEHRDYLLQIKYIEVYYPNTILHTMNLIDTPGLASFYKDDSLGTIEFLKLHGQDLTNITRQEASNADAVLYLFSHSIAAEDAKTVEMFQGPIMGHTTPINSIGVLTKVDAIWPNCDDPLEAGDEIVSRLQNDHPHLRRLFYTIIPVCGKLAWGVQTLTAEEFNALSRLAELPEEAFQKLIRSAERFIERKLPDITKPDREALYERLDLYGVWLAYQMLRSGISDREALVQQLLLSSGLPRLKELILSHFGNRAYLIKLDTALRQIDIACFWARQRESVQGLDREILKRVEATFGQLRDQEQGFSELSVLRDYYQGKLPFLEKEVQHLLQVTGEYGLSDRQRLGLSDVEGELTESDLREMLKKARENAGYWRRRAIDPGASSETQKATVILGDAYDRIGYQIMETMRHRGFTL